MAEEEITTIKQDLTDRFISARDSVGVDWRKTLAATNPFFNTKVGADYMQSAAGVPGNSRRVGVERLRRVVLALEAIVESYQTAEE